MLAAKMVLQRHQPKTTATTATTMPQERVHRVQHGAGAAARSKRDAAACRRRRSQATSVPAAEVLHLDSNVGSFPCTLGVPSHPSEPASSGASTERRFCFWRLSRLLSSLQSCPPAEMQLRLRQAAAPPPQSWPFGIVSMTPPPFPGLRPCPASLATLLALGVSVRPSPLGYQRHHDNDVPAAAGLRATSRPRVQCLEAPPLVDQRHHDGDVVDLAAARPQPLPCRQLPRAGGGRHPRRERVLVLHL